MPSCPETNIFPWAPLTISTIQIITRWALCPSGYEGQSARRRLCLHRRLQLRGSDQDSAHHLCPGGYGSAVADLLLRHLHLPTADQAVDRDGEAANAFAHGHFDVRVLDHNRKDEVGQLARAFNSMAESLEHVENVRREFTSNVSHELKTPLTTISGFVDGILDDTIPPERARTALETVSAEANRLSRLIRSMLDMARHPGAGRYPGKEIF